MNLSLFPTLLAANKYRIIDYDFPRILPNSLNWPSGPLVVLALIAASIAFGILFARWVRMRDYGWRIGLILSTFFVSAFILLFGDYKLGVDLKGGVILVYEVDELETAQLRRGSRDNSWSMSELIAVITKRLNPTGLKEIVVRPFGPKQVEIVVPEVDPAEIENIKLTLRTAGVLQFMIVASDERDSDKELLDIARKQAERGGEVRLRRDVVDDDGRQVGYWARLVREKGENTPFRAYDTIASGLLRDARTGEIIEPAPQQRQLFMNSPFAFDAYLKERETQTVDVLMVYDQDFAIRGDDLAIAYAGHDERFRPAIHFSMRTEGSIKMGHVTGENVRRKLAIIFDGELLSAPVINSKINDNGIIEGNFEQ